MRTSPSPARRPRASAGIAALAAAVLTLTACGPGADPSADPSPTVATETAATATGTPTADDTATSGPAEAAPTTAGDATATATVTAAATDGGTAAPASPTKATKAKKEKKEPAKPVDPLPDGAVTALLLGTDSRTPGSMTGNADAIMVAQISADREDLALVSITRDSWVAIPGMGHGKINAAFATGGTERMRDTVSQLFGGLEIDYVVQTDFEGFIAMTRALGGFEVDNKHYSSVTVNATGRHVEFTQGPTRLENTDGLIYVRERKALPLGDLDRAERQRAAVVGMLDRIESFTGSPKDLKELMTHLGSRAKITGDLKASDLLALAAMTKDLDRDDVVSLMAPLTGFGMISGQSVNLVDEAQTAALGKALRQGDVSGYVKKYGTGYAP